MDDTPWPLIGRAAEWERLRAAARTGAVIVGPAGVGKTRLAQEFARHAAPGRAPVVIVGSASASRIPLGAVSRLLPSNPPPTDRTPVEVALAAVLAPGAFGASNASNASNASDASSGPSGDTAASPHGVLLLVDDAHLLDEASATVVHQAVLSGRATVLATVRSGEPVPDAVTALWKDLGAARIDLGALSDAAVADLVGVALPGPVDGIALGRITAAVQGNALILRELLASAREVGLLAESAGAWRLTGPLTAAPRLTELLLARIGALTPAERSALEVLAVSEPVGVALFAELVPPDVVEAVERRGLAVVTVDGRRREVRLAHPLYGELLRSSMPAIAALRHSRRAAEAVENLGARRRGDVTRVALWRLDGGGEGVPHLLLAAARQAEASRDLALAARLAQAAMDSGGGSEAAMLLASACFDLGRHEAAAALMVSVVESPDAVPDEVLATIPFILSGPMGMGGDDAGALLAVIAAAERRISTPRWQAQLEAVHGHMLSYVNSTDRARELAERHLDDPHPVTRGNALLGAALVDNLTGHLERSIERMELGTAALLGSGLPMSANHDGLVGWQAWQLCDVPDLAAARDLAEATYRSAVDSRARPGQAFACLARSRAELRGGRPATALRHGAEAFAVFREVRSRVCQRWAAAMRVQAAAQLGDVERARIAAEDLEAARRGPNGVQRLDCEVAVAQSWYAAVTGDPAKARAVLSAAIGAAVAEGAVAAAVTTGFELLRLGVRVPALRGLRTRIPEDWRFGQLVLDFAGALGDAEGLLAVSGRFEECGMLLAAAETAGLAAAVWGDSGETRRAAAARGRGSRLAEGCEGARTPLLELLAGEGGVGGTGGAAGVLRLSRREYEIAVLAAGGASSRAIADSLVLSPRTVENHLNRAYAKLGIGGRGDLAGVLPVRAGEVT
ncbi:LuxR family transcriptional regulator [Catenulispora yoronensis]|uniref:LuxR family transcriptional regulator n=1 Tax=Catenulispora yoronensis TaxID=450799 RepID=A0ABN2UNM1_9ACTN